MKEIHLTKNDFKIDGYSGSGAGGQHRNKHQNCCRITHLESGISCNGTSSKSRVSNQEEAFTTLCNRVLQWYAVKEERQQIDLTEVVRNYNQRNNIVHDRRSGLKQPYAKVVISGDIADMIETRNL